MRWPMMLVSVRCQRETKPERHLEDTVTKKTGERVYAFNRMTQVVFLNEERIVKRMRLRRT